MKISRCLLFATIVAFVALTSINCVQNTTTPQPSSSPAASPTLGPLPENGLDKPAIVNKILANPYVNESILNTGWRSAQQIGSRIFVYVPITVGGVTYMYCHEISPGIDRWRALPAVRIVTVNSSQEGVDVVAFYDPGRDRVAYIGYVPRPGAKVGDITFTSVDGGVEEVDRPGGVPREYENVTIVDTGYIEGTNLTRPQADQAVGLAMANATARGYIGQHDARMGGNVSVYSKELGYPYRYILAYPMVILEVTSGPTRYDSVYVWVDLVNNRVVSVAQGDDHYLDTAGFKVLYK